VAGPGGKEVGRVSIRVLPNTSHFGRALGRYLQRVEHQLKVEIPVDLDLKDVPRQIAQVKTLVSQAAKDRVEIKTHVDTDGLGKQLDRATDKVKKDVDRHGRLNLNLGLDGLDTIAHQLRKLSLSKLTQLNDLMGQIGFLAARAGAYVVLLGPPIVLAAAGALALLPALAAALPILAGIAAGVAVVALGGEKLGKAFAPLKKVFTDLKDEIGNVLSQGIQPLARTLATKIAPIFKAGFTDIARAMNGVLRDLLEFASTTEALEGTRQVLDAIALSIRNFGIAVQPLARAMLQITVAALPGFRLLSAYLTGLILRFSAWIDRVSKTGQLEQTITKAMRDLIATLNGVGRVLGAMTGFLLQVEPAARVAFGWLGDQLVMIFNALSTGVSKVNEFAKSFRLGSSSVEPFLLSLTQVVIAVRSVANSVVQWLTPLAGKFASLVGPGLLSFGEKVSSAFLTVLPAVKSLASTLAPVVEDIVTKIGTTLGPGLAQIGTIIRDDVAPALSAFLVAVRPVAKFLLEVFGTALVGALKGVIEVIKGAFKIIAGLFNVLNFLLTGDWDRLWQGIRQIASGAWTAILGLVRVIWNLGILRLFRVGWTAIRGIFTGGWNGVLTLCRSAWRGINGLFNAGGRAIVAVVRGLWTAARSLFNAGIRGIVAIARTGWGSVRSIFQLGFNGIMSILVHLPARIMNVFRGIGSALVDVGRYMIRGLISGIRDAAGEVATAASDVVKGAVSAAKRALHIGSPSKVARDEIGRYISLGIAVGIKRSASQIDSTMKSVLNKAMKTGSRLATGIAKASRQHILALAVRRDEITTLLKDAQKRLADLKKEAVKSADEVANTIVQMGNVTGGQAGFMSSKAIVDNLKKAVITATQFRTALEKLRKAGLNATSLGQVVEAGPQVGLETANAILAGGKGAIKQINSLQRNLSRIGGAVGGDASRVMYEAGIDAAEGLIEGLSARQSELTNAMKAVANQMVRELRRALKIKSPSLVMRDSVGKWLALGVAEGITRHAKVVSGAMGSAVNVSPNMSSAPAAARSAPLMQVENVWAWDEEEAARRLDRRWRDALMQFDLAGVG
jgi:phage-related protein